MFTILHVYIYMGINRHVSTNQFSLRKNKESLQQMELKAKI
jgi:hypothetical protein